MKRDFIVALFGMALMVWIILWAVNKHSPRRKSCFLGMAVTFIIGAIFCTFPIENLFYTFPTVERAAQYLCKGEVIGVVEGRDSCYILCRVNEEEISQVIVPKTTAGYQVVAAFSEKQVAHGMGAAGMVNVKRLRGSDDYYVFAMGFAEGGDAKARDNQGSQFTTLVEGTNFPKEYEMVSFLSYALLEEYTEGYQVIVEGTREIGIIDVKPGGFLSSWVRSLTEGIGEMMGQ